MVVSTSPKFTDFIIDILEISDAFNARGNQQKTDEVIKKIKSQMLEIQKHPCFDEQFLPKYPKFLERLTDWSASINGRALVKEIDSYFRYVLKTCQVEINLQEGTKTSTTLMLNKLDLMNSPFFYAKFHDDRSTLYFNENVDLWKTYINYLTGTPLPEDDFQLNLDLALFCYEIKDFEVTKACERRLIKLLKNVELTSESLKSLCSEKSLAKVIPVFSAKIYKLYQDYCLTHIKDGLAFREALGTNECILTCIWEKKKWKSFRSLLPARNKEFADDVMGGFVELYKSIKSQDWIKLCFFKINLTFFLKYFGSHLEDSLAGFDLLQQNFPRAILKGDAPGNDLAKVINFFAQQMSKQKPGEDSSEALFLGFPKNFLIHKAMELRNPLFMNMIESKTVAQCLDYKQKYIAVSRDLLILKQLQPYHQKELEILGGNDPKIITYLVASKKNIEAFRKKKLIPNERSEKWDSFFKVKFNDKGLITEFDVKNDQEGDEIYLSHDVDHPLACIAKDKLLGQVFSFVLHNLYEMHIQEIKDVIADEHPIFKPKDVRLNWGGRPFMDRLTLAACIMRGAWSLQELITMIREPEKLEPIRGSYKEFPAEDFSLV